MKRIILTGGGTAGHVTPNIALLPRLKELNYDIHYIGSYNGIEKELIEQFGADGVRMGMMLAAPAGNDILFDDALCEQGRNFCNKIWNAFRLIKGWTNGKGSIPVPPEAHLAVQWFDQRLDAAAVEVADLFSKYRLSEALMLVYKLFWDEFSS